MTYAQVVTSASQQVGYHEKQVNTPDAALFPFQNTYDGSDNWTKYHLEIGETQGQDWCGFFCYWVFRSILGTNARTDAFLYGISGHGGAVSSWANAFTPYGQYHEGDAYTPRLGDLVIFMDDLHPWSHIELIVDVSNWPSTIGTIGGNTRNPEDPGDQATGMWVARRTRDSATTTGWRVRGYCEVVYDNYPTGSSGLIIRRRRWTAFG